ncbi:hypothetical protein D9M72_653620 [compost metagenome]
MRISLEDWAQASPAMSDKATNGAIKGFINVAPKGGSANCEAAAVGVEGEMVFPLRSWAVRNEHTTGGMVSPQIPAFDGQVARQWYRLGAGPPGKQ